MDIIKDLEKFVPFNQQEEVDKQLVLWFLQTQPDPYTRNNTLAHMTASAWVVNPRRDKILMVWHNIYKSWSWMGGHADGETDLRAVALREVREECGLDLIKIVSDEIFSIESLTVDGHIKNGQYVSSHLHLNLTWLIEADDSVQVHAKPDENSGVRWFSLRDAVEASSEPWFRQNVYSKLNKKLTMV